MNEANNIAEANIVAINNLSKRFGGVQALDRVNLELPSGRIVGLLGANGCGKSTLLRHIVGLLRMEAGSCQTFGRSVTKLGPQEMSRIGYVHQEGELLNWMTVPQLIRYVAAYYPTWNVELERKFVEEFGVPLEARVGSLSPGQRQVLAVLLAIGFEPELLILDEPAAGLDPLSRQRFLNLLLDIIQAPGRTIVISSHILSDVEKVIDHVVIMDRGSILRDVSLDDLREEFCRVRVSSLNGGPLPDELPFTNIVECQRGGAEALLTIQSLSGDVLEGMAKQCGARLEMNPLSLEDLYRLVVVNANPRSSKQ